MKTHLSRFYLVFTILALNCSSMCTVRADEDPDAVNPDTDVVGGGGAGSDSPTGLSGSFGGSIQTGAGSFDPAERNASRTVTDIVMPGAVVPFTFTRIWNSRSNSDPNLFPSGWRHNWKWEIFQLTADQEPILPDPDHVIRLFRGFLINYPDGRSIRFWRPTPTSDYGAVGYYTASSLSVKDTFHVDDALHAHLTQSDGTVVTFDLSGSPGTVEKVTGVIDPFGQKVTISVTNQGMLITEPALRWIYVGAVQGPPGSTQAMTVTTSLNQSVHYLFTPSVRGSALGRGGDQDNPSVFEGDLTVTYDNVLGVGGQPVKAEYVYKQVGQLKYGYSANNPSVPYPPGFYRLAWASDPMFEGPMQKVKYTYVDGPTAFSGDAELTAVLEERYTNSYYQGASIDPGVTTIRVEMPFYTQTGLVPPLEYWTRKETRDNGTVARTISYFNPTSGNGQTLVDHFTDFTNNPAISERHEYDWTHSFQTPTKITDMRGNISQQTLESTLGHVTQETHPDTKWRAWSYDNPAAPYYVQTTTDENGRITTYRRDTNHRVWRVEYPDASFEEFTYNGFGQVLTHTMKGTAAEPGRVETYTYDNRGLKLSYAQPPTASDPAGHATTYAYYSLSDPAVYRRDRLWYEIDPRGNRTTYDYNARGQATRITHQDGSYMENVYDLNTGTLTSTRDEEGRVTSYLYDEYKRVIRVTDNLGHATTKSYDRWDATGRTQIANSHLDHTEDFVFREVSAAGIITDQNWGQNHRLIWRRVGTGTADEATTSFHYDPAGNLDWTQDPRGYTTSFENDNRNRKTKSTPPPPFAAQVTSWEYDPTGDLVTKENRPDGTYRQLEYDVMNRLWKEHEPRTVGGLDRVTTYEYFPSGMLKSVQDANLHTTSFTYDKRNLKETMTYPNNQLIQKWKYDFANNLITRPTADPAQTQTFHYDNRNRIDQMRWNNGIDFSDFTYDKTNRLLTARNPYSTITRVYDAVGRLSTEQQALAITPNTAQTTIQPQSVVSRMTHSSAGTFDIDLPLTGDPGSECRDDGSATHTIVLTFATPPSHVEGARVADGLGEVSGITLTGNELMVNLANVSNAQILSVQIYGIEVGDETGEVTVPMKVLLGDSTGNGTLESTDSLEVGNAGGTLARADNFRADVNADGVIDQEDADLVEKTGMPEVTNAGAVGPSALVTRDYEFDGRLKNLGVSGTDYHFIHGYDGLGRLTTITLVNGAPQSPYYQYYYDKSSNVILRYNWLTGTAQCLDRDELNRVSARRINTNFYDSQGGHLYEYSKEVYGYDPMSRLLTTDRTLRFNNFSTEVRRDEFAYDDLGELVLAKYDRTPSGQGFTAPARTVSYNLDKVGNRNSVVDSGITTGYSPNVLNQYGETTNGSEHQVSGYQGVNYTYLGDTRLSAVSSTAGGVYQMGYDALGRCVKRTSGGVSTYYVFDGERALIEYNQSGGVLASSVFGVGLDEIIARYNNGKHQWFLQDRNGNTSAITDQSGMVVEQYRYDAFGQPEFRGPPVSGNPRGVLRSTSLENNRFLFTGREWVQNYGFYEYRARAYNPTLGRFMSEDPLGIQTKGVKPSAGAFPNVAPGQLPKEFADSETNLFGYCGNDPLDELDPLGLLPDGPVGAEDREAIADSINAIGNVISHGLNAAIANVKENPDYYVGLLAAIADGLMSMHGEGADPGMTFSRATSRAARRQVMREVGIPTSQQPVAQSRNKSGREYRYETPKAGGGLIKKTVQDQTKDRAHLDNPHWEAGTAKTDPITGKIRLGGYGRPTIENAGKQKIYYPKE